MKEGTLKILEEKLKKEHISQRSKGNVSLSYIESHHAIREANRAFGFNGWSYEIIDLKLVSEETNQNGNNVIGYTARVKVTVSDITREDVGFGNGIAKMKGDAHEGATKEAISDAMKRALRTFGDIFGLALYDKKQEHVETEEDKKEDSNLKAFLQKVKDGIKVIGEDNYKKALDEYHVDSADKIPANLRQNFITFMRTFKEDK